MQHRGAMSRVWALGLTIKGTDAIIDLRGEFSPDAVRQACIAQGWRFDKQRRNWRGMLKLSWSPACEYSAGHQRVPGAATALPCGLGMLSSAAERAVGRFDLGPGDPAIAVAVSMRETHHAIA
jgi:hypothetical protein